MNLFNVAEILRNARPMTQFEEVTFAGAPEGAMIAESEVAVYIISENQISVITDDSETRYELNKIFEIGV